MINRGIFPVLMMLVLGMISGPLFAADWEVVKGGIKAVGGSNSGTFRAAAFGNGVFVAVGDDTRIETSTDGKTWTVRKENDAQHRHLYAVTYGNGMFVAVGRKGYILTSTNGSSWTERQAYGTGESLTSVAYGQDGSGGDLYAAGGIGRVQTSPDGITWTDVSTGLGAKEVRGMCWGDGKFIGAVSGGVIYYSSNGTNWQAAGVNTGVNNYSAVYENGTYVVGGGTGVIYTSSNGTSWTKITTNQPNHVMDLAFSGEDFFGCGDGNYVGCSMVIVSPTGSSWKRDFIGYKTVTGGQTTYQNEYSTLLGAAAGDGNMIVAGARKSIIYNTSAGAGDGKGCIGTAGPSITVVQPNGGEFLKSGTTYTIKWTSKSVTDPIRIRYTKDDGADDYDNIVIGSTVNNGEYNWTVPNIKSTKCKVKVLAYNQSGTPYDLSNSVFEIGTTPTSSYITVVSPNGGETLKSGTTYTIKWSGTKKYDKVDIEYNNGSSWVVIKNGVADTGSYSWTVPNLNTTKGRLWMKGWSSTGNATDYSDGLFTITNGQLVDINITAPNGGEEWDGGSTQNITWTSSRKFDKVDIEYYNGSKWVVIQNGVSDTGSYAWKIPMVSTTKAKIWMKGWSSGGNDTDTSDATFTLKGGATINFTSPNGGEEIIAGSTHKITWVSSIKFDKVDIEYFNGSKWNPIVTAAPDTGSYDWSVPNISTTKARLWMKGWSSKGNDTDYTDAEFTIKKLIGTITITSPNGGERWVRGNTYDITWTTTGTIGNVKLAYSVNGGTNWSTIASSTPNDGVYSWATPSSIKSDECKIRVNDTTHTEIIDISDDVFSISTSPVIGLSRYSVNFGYVDQGPALCDQSFFIYNQGGGWLEWKADVDPTTTWLSVEPASGTGAMFVKVKVNPAGMTVGTYTSKITISASGANNSPFDMPVNFKILAASDDKPPFGSLATPEEGATVSGAIAISGWALDDVCLQGATIYRMVNDEPSQIGEALFIEGARPDVAAAYPDYPDNTKAGWGYVMLTNFLPDGEMTLKVVAKDNAGNEVELGTRKIVIDNANAKKPFGAVDTPSMGGEASGTLFRNVGWTLTPQPNEIPRNGSTINIYIDGIFAGKATYNLYRKDIADLFPDLANSNGAMGYFDFDTTKYENGPHAIAWSVEDSGGNIEGIGSRFFLINNPIETTSSGLFQACDSETPSRLTGRTSRPVNLTRDSDIVESIGKPVISSTLRTMDVKELDRIEISLQEQAADMRSYSGYLLVNGHINPLPFGSHLNCGSGVFTWQLSAGFIGDYELVFFIEDEQGNLAKKYVVIRVNPKNR